MKKAIAVLLLAYGLIAARAPYAMAAEAVLVEQVQPEVTNDAAMDVVKQALARKKWKVVSSTGDSVVAELYKDSIDAKIEIFLAGRSIKYREVSVARYVPTASFGPANTGTEHRVKTSASLPEQWMTELRQDINERLPATPAVAPVVAAPQQAAAAPPSAKTRLETLKELLDAKLITQAEYDQKRQQILEGL